MKNRTHDGTAWSLLIFGSYALIMGLVLLLAPEQLLPLFGFAESSGTWVHVLGFVLCCSAYYYLYAGWSGNRAFARLTVHTRLASPLVMLALLATGKGRSHGPAIRDRGCGRWWLDVGDGVVEQGSKRGCFQGPMRAAGYFDLMRATAIRSTGRAM